MVLPMSDANQKISVFLVDDHLVVREGVRVVLEQLGDGFVRFRLGIGPKAPAEMDLKDYVLGKFTTEQINTLQPQLDHQLHGLDLLLQSGVARAMNLLNRRETNETDQP